MRGTVQTEQSTLIDTAATAIKRAAIISGQDDVYPSVVTVSAILQESFEVQQKLRLTLLKQWDCTT